MNARTAMNRRTIILNLDSLFGQIRGPIVAHLSHCSQPKPVLSDRHYGLSCEVRSLSYRTR